MEKKNLVIFCFDVLFFNQTDASVSPHVAELLKDERILRAFIASSDETGFTYERFRNLSLSEHFSGHDLKNSVSETVSLDVSRNLILWIQKTYPVGHVFVIGTSPQRTVAERAGLHGPVFNFFELGENFVPKRCWRLPVSDIARVVNCN